MTHLLSMTCLFADDMFMASTSSDINDLQCMLNHDLEIIFNWSKKKVPPYFLHGHRFPSVIHARLRNKCSDLNGDLF